MSKFTDRLIEEMAGGESAEGTISNSPLSSALLAKSKPITNKKPQPIKLIKYDDEDMDEEDDDFDINQDPSEVTDDESEDDDDDVGVTDDMLSTDDEPVEEPNEETRQLFQQFKSWLVQNKDSLMDIEGDDDIEQAEQDVLGDAEEELDDEDGQDLYTSLSTDSSEEDEEPEMGDSEVPDDQQIVAQDDNNMDVDVDIEGDVENEDPNRQGMIRVVQGAHLIYKRQQPDGFYEELWMYNIGNDAAQDEMEVKQNILAGTDIKPNQTKSDDGTQSYEIWTSGNGQMICVSGIQN